MGKIGTIALLYKMRVVSVIQCRSGNIRLIFNPFVRRDRRRRLVDDVVLRRQTLVVKTRDQGPPSPPVGPAGRRCGSGRG